MMKMLRTATILSLFIPATAYCQVDIVLYPTTGEVVLSADEPTEIAALDLVLDNPGHVEPGDIPVSAIVQGPYPPDSHLSCTPGFVAVLFPPSSVYETIIHGPVVVAVLENAGGFLPDVLCQAEGWLYAVPVGTHVYSPVPGEYLTGELIVAPDFTGDGVVDVSDLLAVLGREPFDVSDLLLVLGAMQ